MQALSYKNENFNIKEPFDGLFTQGMVCHETYKKTIIIGLVLMKLETINGKKYLLKEKSIQK